MREEGGLGRDWERTVEELRVGAAFGAVDVDFTGKRDSRSVSKDYLEVVK